MYMAKGIAGCSKLDTHADVSVQLKVCGQSADVVCCSSWPGTGTRYDTSSDGGGEQDRHHSPVSHALCAT